MPSEAQKVRPNNSRSDKLVFLAAVLGASMFPIAICREATTTQNATEPIWPTKEWQTSTPEVEGMDSKELTKLVDWGTTHSFDSLLVVRLDFFDRGSIANLDDRKKAITVQNLLDMTCSMVIDKPECVTMFDDVSDAHQRLSLK